MDQPVSVPGSCTNLTTLVPCDWQFDDPEGVHHSAGVRLQVVQPLQQEPPGQSALADTRGHLVAGTERVHSTQSVDRQVDGAAYS